MERASRVTAFIIGGLIDLMLINYMWVTMGLGALSVLVGLLAAPLVVTVGPFVMGLHSGDWRALGLLVPVAVAGYVNFIAKENLLTAADALKRSGRDSLIQ